MVLSLKLPKKFKLIPNYGEGFVSGYHKTLNKIVIKNSKQNITAKTKKIEKIKFDKLGLYNLNI